MLRGGIVGFGRMGMTHFSILNTHPSVHMVAVSDSSNYVLKNATQQMGITAFSRYDKMIDAMGLDFVIVATPTVTHAEVAKYAMLNKAHVFVEKPLTLHPELSRELLDLAQENNVLHQVGYVMRFHEVFMKAKQLLDAGAFGPVVTFNVEMNGPVVLHEAKKSWRAKKMEGGGCLYDFASHICDLVNFFIGPPDEVGGSVLTSIYSDGVEDAVSATFLYKNGIRGNLLANWSDASYRKPSTRFEILGQNGKMFADFYTLKMYFHKKPEGTPYTVGWNEIYLADIAEPVRFYVRGFQFTRQLDYFIDCIQNKVKNNVNSFADGYSTDTIIHRIRSDAERWTSHVRQNHSRRQPILRDQPYVGGKRSRAISQV